MPPEQGARCRTLRPKPYRERLSREKARGRESSGGDARSRLARPLSQSAVLLCRTEMRRASLTGISRPRFFSLWKASRQGSCPILTGSCKRMGTCASSGAYSGRYFASGRNEPNAEAGKATSAAKHEARRLSTPFSLAACFCDPAASPLGARTAALLAAALRASRKSRFPSKPGFKSGVFCSAYCRPCRISRKRRAASLALLGAAGGFYSSCLVQPSAVDARLFALDRCNGCAARRGDHRGQPFHRWDGGAAQPSGWCAHFEKRRESALSARGEPSSSPGKRPSAAAFEQRCHIKARLAAGSLGGIASIPRRWGGGRADCLTQRRPARSGKYYFLRRQRPGLWKRPGSARGRVSIPARGGLLFRRVFADSPGRFRSFGRLRPSLCPCLLRRDRFLHAHARKGLARSL